MEKTRRVALILILLSSGFSVLWGSWLAHQSFSGMSDFRTIYYGSRCLLQRVNPYQPDQFLRVYRAE